MNNLFEHLSTATRNQSELINAGLDPEQATRIAFENNQAQMDEVNDERLSIIVNSAFICFKQRQLCIDNGKPVPSEKEAVKNCIKVIKDMLA